MKVADFGYLFGKATAPNILIIMQHVLAIPVTNAHVERLFSAMNGLWTDDRNRMSTELAEICLKMNLNVNCQGFYKMAQENKRLLESARNSNKYKF